MTDNGTPIESESTAFRLDTITQSDALAYVKTLPSESVHSVVTSPPYYAQRDYGADAQIGLEHTPQEYIARLVAVFAEIMRVLRSDGNLWVNLGDSYSSTKGRNSSHHQTIHGTSRGEPIQNNKPDLRKYGWQDKQLIGVPWRFAFAMQDLGYILRSDIIWAKPAPMPESVKDRPTKAHEYIFLFAKQGRYYYDADAIKEQSSGNSHGAPLPNAGNKQRMIGQSSGKTTLGQTMVENTMRNKRTVWSVAHEGYTGSHFATMPAELVKTCILAGCPVDGVVLDPFMGAGTTAMVAKRLNRHYIGCDLNAEYIALANERIQADDPYADKPLADGVQLSLLNLEHKD